MEWQGVAGIAVLALAVHVWVLRVFAPRRALGDECEYLERGRWSDPHRPTLYLRVPGIATLMRLAALGFRDPERGLRLAGALLGALAVVLVALAGAMSGLGMAGLLAAIVLLALPERVLLSAHLWPDTLLCTLHAAALALAVSPQSDAVTLALGMVAMLATLVRIEQLALAAGLLLLVVWRDPSQVALSSLLLLGPSLAALALWTCIAWRRYGIALPDTTWLFNLRILQGQVQAPEAGPVRVQGTIAALLRRHRQGEAHPPLSGLVRKTPSLMASALRRLLACFGPDTFVTGRLIPPMGQAYPAMQTGTAGCLAVGLRWCYPMLAAVSIWALLVSNHWPDYLLVAVPVLLSLVVVHFRSRYRLVLMPWLFLAGAECCLRLEPATIGLPAWLGLTALLVLSGIQVRRPLIIEHDDQIPRRAASGDSKA